MKKFDIVTCVHKIEFTPRHERIFSFARDKLKVGGYFYLTTGKQSFFKEWFRKRKIVNVYEGNPYYKIGPYTFRSRSELIRTSRKFDFKLQFSGARVVLGHSYNWLIFQKI